MWSLAGHLCPTLARKYPETPSVQHKAWHQAGAQCLWGIHARGFDSRPATLGMSCCPSEHPGPRCLSREHSGAGEGSAGRDPHPGGSPGQLPPRLRAPAPAPARLAAALYFPRSRPSSSPSSSPSPSPSDAPCPLPGRLCRCSGTPGLRPLRPRVSGRVLCLCESLSLCVTLPLRLSASSVSGSALSASVPRSPAVW